jgi:hypothetical protein
MFHTSTFGAFKAAHPALDIAALNNAMMEEWSALDAAEKQGYVQQAQDLAEANKVCLGGWVGGWVVGWVGGRAPHCRQRAVSG